MNQRQHLMKVIEQASFAMDDTRLFLDTHPNCQEAIEHFQKMQDIRNKAWDEYTEQYGPLGWYDVECSNEWIWNQGPMPWERGGC